LRLAILGGSFNPVHLGHLFLADTVLSTLHYDRVVLVPACRSPFKLEAANMESTAADRLQMLAASIAADPRLALDDCELKRGGVSYTVDTVKDIIRRYQSDGKPGLIIGDDLAADFPQWHNSDEILALADIIIARRVHSGEIRCPFPNTQITNEVMEISSALVRERIADGGAWRCLVPQAAGLIIEERGLYGTTPNGVSAAAGSMGASPQTGRQTIARIEEAARAGLSPERFLHSRNTALLAWDLCRRFALDPEAGYLAGIAHDLAKSLGDTALLRLVKSAGVLHKSGGGKITKLEKKKPALLHGRAAAVLLRERFGIHNEDILEAVALHTEGGENMGSLAKVVYIADKLEVSREKANPVLRQMCYTETDLEKLFSAVLNDTVSWLRSKKIDLSEETFRLLEKMKEKR
jgi:nicotinate-nucleotide adenylyltransferase